MTIFQVLARKDPLTLKSNLLFGILSTTLLHLVSCQTVLLPSPTSALAQSSADASMAPSTALIVESATSPPPSSVPAAASAIITRTTTAVQSSEIQIPTSLVPSASSSTSIAPNGAITVVVVTVFQAATTVSSSSASPTSTSDSNSTSNQNNNSSSNTSIVLWIFLGVVGCIIVAACGIYAFRCVSLRASPSFRKRLSNEDGFDEVNSHSSNSSPPKNASADRVVYPTHISQQQMYPSTLRPIRYNVSSSTLGSLSSQPGIANVVVGYPIQQMAQNPHHGILYPPYSSLSTSAMGSHEGQGVAASDEYYPFDHTTQPSYDYDPSHVAYYEEAVPVMYEDGTVAYVAQSQVIEPAAYYYADPAPARPVIVRVGSAGSHLYQQGYEEQNDPFPDTTFATLDLPQKPQHPLQEQ